MKRGTKIQKVRPYQATYYRGQAEHCLKHLRRALEAAKAAGAPCTVKRIRFAISSARGAVRNAGYRVSREEARR